MNSLLRRLRPFLAGLLWATWLVFLPATDSERANAQIPPAEDAPQPSPPEVSRELFTLKEGFRIDLVASEPLIADPSGIAWDENGRLFVCELHGYNLEGHFDIVELNKTGELDRKVRRIPASPEAKRRAESGTYGTVKQLFDDDSDGRMDRALVWADRLPPCYGLIAARGGVIVVCAPDIVYLADRDGDGKAEVLEKLFTGFGTGALERGINSPRWGADYWIYVAGAHGGRITGPHLAEPVSLGGSDFRFRADGSAIEPVTGSSHTFGMTLTEFGDRFLVTTSRHARYAVPLPHRYLVRNPYVPAPSSIAEAASYTRIYPASKPHPWRLARSQDPEWVRFYGEHETTPSGLFTSACGQLVYRGALFPPEYRGDHFSCDPQNNLVHHCKLARDGAGFRALRPDDERTREFLVSSEKWFRPNGLVTGPDGAIYIVDMYREIIEDYSAIPRFLQQQYGLIRGNDRGRIWRIAPAEAPPGTQPSLGNASVEELARNTGHPDVWWRNTARRLLLERDARGVVPLLRKQARNAGSPAARLCALTTLEGLDALEAEDLQHALGDMSWGVRRQALRLASTLEDTGARTALLESELDLLDDPDPAVRLQLAMSLGDHVPGNADATTEPRVVDALAKLAVRHGEERWMAAAIASSLAQCAAEFLVAVARLDASASQAAEAARLAAATVGARRRGSEIARALELAARLKDRQSSWLVEATLRGVSEGLGRNPGGVELTESSTDALEELLADDRQAVRDHAVEIIDAAGVERSQLLASILETARSDVLDREIELSRRLAAARLLQHAPLANKSDVCARLLSPDEPLELQLAAVEALRASDDARVAAPLLAGWATYTPRLRRVVIDAVFERENRLPTLLEALESGRVSPAVIDRFHRLQLLEHADAALRSRALEVFKGSDRVGARAELFERFAAALSRPGDAQRGAAVFAEHCQPCHRVGDAGHAVGPDLASERERADLTLLEDILSPSRQITAGYSAYTAITRDGLKVSGVLADESATSVTLKQAGGEGEPILRRDIVKLEASPVSLMPDNFGELLQPGDVAGVIAYLRATFGDVAPGSVVLFDDEAKFVEQLRQGGGTAKLVDDDVHSGRAALRVTPPQRYSDRISGWEFEIRQHPQPGEYRYLRLAWKTDGGHGVLVELAASGSWPRPDDPRRRYYSGRNTTEWQAQQVSSQAPTDWTVVTVDLWKDCGSFTLTGIAPTAMGGAALFDRIELLRSLEGVEPAAAREE